MGTFVALVFLFLLPRAVAPVVSGDRPEPEAGTRSAYAVAERALPDAALANIASDGASRPGAAGGRAPRPADRTLVVTPPAARTDGFEVRPRRPAPPATTGLRHGRELQRRHAEPEPAAARARRRARADRPPRPSRSPRRPKRRPARRAAEPDRGGRARTPPEPPTSSPRRPPTRRSTASSAAPARTRPTAPPATSDRRRPPRRLPAARRPRRRPLPGRRRHRRPRLPDRRHAVRPPGPDHRERARTTTASCRPGRS
jgi:hypothetical protein